MYGPVARGTIFRIGVKIEIDDRRLRAANLMTTAAGAREQKSWARPLPRPSGRLVVSAECEGTAARPQLSAGNVEL